MKDNFGRNICYLRLSITDRCNLSCEYCRPSNGIKPIPISEFLSFDEIIQFVSTGAQMGIKKIRLTGGEPLLREGIISLTKRLSKIEGISDISMTTNGILLEDFANSLYKEGLKRVNVSLDTMDPEHFKKRCGGDINRVLSGIMAAKKAGMAPIKINCVVDDMGKLEDKDPKSPFWVAQFAQENGFHIRFIPRMDLATGRFSKILGGDGGDCEKCNRLRLSAHGLLRPCLFNNICFDIRKMGHKEALLAAISKKPEKGISSCASMCAIGG